MEKKTLLREVALELGRLGIIGASVEQPDCIHVTVDATTNLFWAFGIANSKWEGDLNDNGAHRRSVDLYLSVHEQRVQLIAFAIASVLHPKSFPTGVGILAVDTECRGIWMSRRLEECGDFIGFWQVPGGRMNPQDEHVWAAARRELKEETSLWASDAHAHVKVLDGPLQKPEGETYRSVQFMLNTDQEPKHKEPNKNTKWELVHFARVRELHVFGAIAKIFGSSSK